MSKIKKVLAMLLALAMVLGTTLTAFAAPKDTATITVKESDGSLSKAAFKYVQVIEPSQTTVTGWAFSSAAIEQAYLEAFGLSDSQAVIQEMIDLQKASPNTAGNAEKVRTALSKVAALNIFDDMTNPQEVTVAGVYAIKGSEEGYTYSNMSAYVGFGKIENNEYPSLTDADVTAKKTPTTVIKTDDDKDNVVQIGDIVTYTIEAYVPFIDEENINKTFSITDKITGADYYLTGENSQATVAMEGKPDPVATATDFVLNNDKKGFTITLDSLVNNKTNENAGKKITVTYTAKVNDTIVENEAGSHVSGNDYSSEKVTLYTAEITMVKYASDDTETLDDNEKLANAGFVIYKLDGQKKLYAKFDSNNKFAGWGDEADAVEVITNSEGSLKIEGLDVGTYYFQEKTAPKGYSLNTAPSIVEIKLNQGQTEATEIIKANTHMLDTKLSSLPSTGGIGTTIFTIGGCLIMIAAAGLFFASRRKSAK